MKGASAIVLIVLFSMTSNKLMTKLCPSLKILLQQNEPIEGYPNFYRGYANICVNYTKKIFVGLGY